MPGPRSCYHQRWEEGAGNDQLKTHLRGPGKVLRSRLPDLVYQEIWAWLIVHSALSWSGGVLGCGRVGMISRAAAQRPDLGAVPHRPSQGHLVLRFVHIEAITLARLYALFVVEHYPTHAHRHRCSGPKTRPARRSPPRLPAGRAGWPSSGTHTAHDAPQVLIDEGAWLGAEQSII